MTATPRLRRTSTGGSPLLALLNGPPLGLPALPFLWKSPHFCRPLKVVLTVLALAHTALLIGEAIRLFRAVTSEMDVLTDF